MNSEEIKKILHRYFEAETSREEEKILSVYFNSGNVDEELSSYTPLFRGIAEISDAAEDVAIENDVMNFIIIHESKEKTKFRHLWKFVAGIAASLLILISGYLVYENQRQTYKDTFKNPYQAYAFAEETLRYVSSKYNKGLVQLTNFDKIEKASFPLKKGIMPFAGFIYGIEKMIKEQTTIKN